MEQLITSKPYTINHHQPLEAHFATLSLEDLRKIQQKKEEEKIDYSPECEFMRDDKKKLDKLVSATVVDIVKSRRKPGRPTKNKK
jgi:hypothetical protein